MDIGLEMGTKNPIEIQYSGPKTRRRKNVFSSLNVFVENGKENVQEESLYVHMKRSY